MQNNLPSATLAFKPELPSESYHNRRVHQRFKRCDLAEIIIHLEGRVITCLVHNISEGGAMIESSTRELPKRFILNYQKENTRKICRVVWSCGNLSGLAFL